MSLLSLAHPSKFYVNLKDLSGHFSELLQAMACAAFLS